MTFLPSLALLFAQAAAAVPPPVEQDRLALCLDEARRDPATAIVTADAWLDEAHGAGRALPQQCLGQAYVSLLRWDAAHAAFLAGRDALAETARADRARLGAMAGNAALAEEKYDAALAAFDTALGDAAMGGDTPLAGTISADRARAGRPAPTRRRTPMPGCFRRRSRAGSTISLQRRGRSRPPPRLRQRIRPWASKQG